ncbi:MAG: phenylacetate--CoA ligase family protein [Promethearchaeota archaeon]|nr:MAG: phenylacetate--CoA ligase family protein [Candidatus Lokiarchaeota archaeon]
MEYNYFDEKREKTPWSELETNWIKRGRWTLKRLYDTIPSLNKRYKEAGIVPDDIKSVEDFKKVPYLTKQDFLDAFPDKLICVPKEDIIRMHATSGTSGHRPTCGYYTQKDLDDWSYLCARNLGAIGMTKKDVFQNTTSAGLFTGGFGYAQGCTVLGAMLIPFGPGMTSRQLEFFKTFKVTSFHAIPSFGLRLAQVMEEEGIKKDDLFLKYAILGAEGWAESTRKTIEERLGIKAYDNWGMTECYGPGPTVECQEQNGLHIWSDYFYPEIIDPETGEVLPYGETGELVMTSLYKEAIPIFRYRTGDITAIHKSECPCGRTGFMMDRIKGRKDDMHVIKGVNVYPSMIEEEIFNLSNYFTDVYLIVYHTVGVMDTVTVNVEAKPGVDKAKAQEELEKNLREATFLGINVTTFDPGTLPRQEGKAIRLQDIRDRPDGYKGWLKMLKQQK